ncbi:unnamed protein product [Heligmosomoides polygyrus]|uniref:CCHC-type domain-containing protein n=1 Tax=Heligmosomoides polygyrus TaxID=6339 RepID=A0A183G0T8_HELPZ|nr:unnamed protein product [Heligmosomoides polygyrus]
MRRRPRQWEKRSIPGRGKRVWSHARETIPQKGKCYICHEFGHLAKDCAEGDRKAKTEKKRAPTSLLARLGGACRPVEAEEVSKSSPLFGKRLTTTVVIFGREWTALLDTGSEISILPGQVLRQARTDGVDIDRDVVEHPLDTSKRVCDASGPVMSFVAVVEASVHEKGRIKEAVNAK